LRSFAHFALFDEFFPQLAARPRTGRIAPERTSPTHFAKRVDARVRCRAIFRERYFYGLFFRFAVFRGEISRRQRASVPLRTTQPPVTALRKYFCKVVDIAKTRD
jgi:hypothetical protein